MRTNTLLLSISCFFLGFIAAYLLVTENHETVEITEPASSALDKRSEAIHDNPFRSAQNDEPDINRLQLMEQDIRGIKQQLKTIETVIAQNDTPTGAPPELIRGMQSSTPSALEARLYGLENLIKGGIDPVLAEQIVRQKNSIELKRLELQDRAKRNNYLNTQRYYDELDAINQQDTSLRESLGDEQYDQYLYNIKQNNRIRIASVIIGSAAEQAGIQKHDVVLSYDNKRMFSWHELRDATTAGELGDYVSITIYRNGEIYSYSVPRGPLGVQLGATRLPP